MTAEAFPWLTAGFRRLPTGMNRHPQTDSMTPSTLASANMSIASAPEGRC